VIRALLVGAYEPRQRRDVPFRSDQRSGLLAKRFGATDGHKYVNGG
jgi:transcription termination factor NusB